MWPDVMARLSALKRTTWSLVSHYAQVLDYDGKRLLLQFDSPGRAASFGRGAHQEFLRQALIDVLGIDCGFEAVAGDGRGSAAAAPPESAGESPSNGLGGASRGAPPTSAARPGTGAPVEAARGPATRRAVAQIPPADDDVPLPPEPPPDDIPPEERSGRPPVRLADDEPSIDDVDLEGADLVGATVVEQLLGGRVIEDRQE
jgi:DNA polymerase-3 subunit gamma/tau